MRCLLLIFAAVVSGTLAGCDGGQEPDETAPLRPADFADLAPLKEIPNAKLRDELARIEEEGGTPELLSRRAIADELNVAAGLRELFPEDQVASIREKSRSIFPPGRFEFNPIQLQKAIHFRTKYDQQRLKAREALKRPECRFDIPFTDGLLVELRFVPVVHLCADLEAYRAAESLSEGKLDEAAESLGYMLRLASCLGAEKCALTRLHAAQIRTKAFGVLQAVVKHPAIEQKHLERLRDMVDEQLESWPDDAWAWIGERSSGLHFYAMVADGLLEDLLTEEQKGRFDAQSEREEFAATAKRTVETDVLYYLETMRKIIESCRQPYCLREDLFDAISEELQQRRNAADFPLVAGRLLLPDIRQQHADQAQDRANWEGWALALALATGRPLPPHTINPLTGKEYVYQEFQYEDHRDEIGVRGLSDDEADLDRWIIVPVVPAAGEAGPSF